MLFDFAYPNVWDALKKEEKVVLYGMGDGADKVLDEMRKRGFRPVGVMASDDFVRYQDFHGFTVKKQSDLEEELGDFCVALCFASSLENVMRHIRQVGAEHRLLVPTVPVVGNEAVDDGFLERYRGEITDAYFLLADDASKKVFENTLHFLYTGRLSYLSEMESAKAEVFSKILKLHDESYLDLGAYRGDTVEEFLRYTDGYSRITAVEPNPKNFRKLVENTAGLRDFQAVNAGISDAPGEMFVSKKSGRMAALNAVGGERIAVTSVDLLGVSPTYIKTDIEGMEEKMLLGAKKTLRQKPKLDLAAYHRNSDFFRLVLLLHALQPDYRIYLRKHPYIPCWDLNIYAVPRE